MKRWENMSKKDEQKGKSVKKDEKCEHLTKVGKNEKTVKRNKKNDKSSGKQNNLKKINI